LIAPKFDRHKIDRRHILIATNLIAGIFWSPQIWSPAYFDRRSNLILISL
jgi:hypothetical protein